MILFLDFDGTITTRDATDAVLEAYADPDWLRVEEAWKAGRINSRECLTAQMALVTATAGQVDALLDSIEVDEGFVSLLGQCATSAVPVHIISDGFDYCIQRILSRHALGLARYLAGVQIVSSHLEPRGTRWHASFGSFASCTHGCATCKPETMQRLNTSGGRAVFVGDGLSDRYAAAAADVVFAKDALAGYCGERDLSYFPYKNLADVSGWVERMSDNRRPNV
jgi:2-hydroxy-3-keto-5-methylthiopentenyl-1-phosphate phosphatase